MKSPAHHNLDKGDPAPDMPQPSANTARAGRSRFLNVFPMSGVETTGDGRFRSSKLDAHFELRSSDDRMPKGPVRLSFDLMGGTNLVEAVLRVVSEDHPRTEIFFPASPTGQFQVTALLPKHVIGLELELRNQSGIFALRKFRVRALSAPEFLISRAGNLSILRRALRYLGRHGIRATMHKAFTAPEYHQGSDPYLEWVRRNDRLTPADMQAIQKHIKLLPVRPLISIIVPVYNTRPDFLRDCLQSVRNQLYQNWELCIADDGSDNPDIWPILTKFASGDKRVKLVRRPVNGNICAASNSALSLATGSHIALLDHDDLLPPHALYMLAVELSLHPDADLIYSDEDKVDAVGNRYGPHFKSDWNYDLLTSCNMICHLSVYRTAVVRALGGFREGFEGSQDYDLTLRVIEHTTAERIRHIPFILYHWRVFNSSGSFSTDKLWATTRTARLALSEHFARKGEIADVIDGGSGETHRICRPLPTPLPLVSLLVPTRDRLSLLRTCVEGLLENTDYDAIEIIILDNESTEPETLDYLKSMEGNPWVRVEHCPGAFNFSALNNRGAELARGQFLGLVNNDIEVIDPGWLKEMIGHALRPNVGAVGAKLLYPDGRLQHAGVTLGIGGVAGHAFKYFANSAVGYFRRAKLTQNFSAVTGACLVMRKDRYLAAGGLDAKELKIAFNDIDLCLKLRAAGYDIVWTPYAVLRHHESATRGTDNCQKNAERFAKESETMQRRWGATLDNDPFYNPNLTLLTEDFRLAETPRTIRPWLANATSKTGPKH